MTALLGEGTREPREEQGREGKGKKEVTNTAPGPWPTNKIEPVGVVGSDYGMRWLIFGSYLWALFASIAQALSTLVIKLRKLERHPERVTYVFHLTEPRRNIWQMTPEEMQRQTSLVGLMHVPVAPGQQAVALDTHLTRPFSGVILWWGDQYEKYSVADNDLIHYPQYHQIILRPRVKVRKSLCSIM